VPLDDAAQALGGVEAQVRTVCHTSDTEPTRLWAER
jgi:hypothetical protein